MATSSLVKLIGERTVTAARCWMSKALFAVLGLFLVTFVTIRVSLGLSSLPLSLRSARTASPESEVSWYRLQLVIYFLVFLLFLFINASDTLLYFPYARFKNTVFALPYRFVAEAISEALIVTLCVWVGGKRALKNALSSLRFPSAGYVLLASAVPVAFALFVSLGLYLYAFADWAQHGFNQFTKASFTDYFPYARLWSAGLLIHVWWAFGEEIIFRGILLPRLMNRYDFYQGIFLTGIIWAAYHFHSNAHLGLSFGRVFIGIGYRLAICMAMNYGLAWVTLRSGSIIPAGIAHTVSNILIDAGVNGATPCASYLRVLFWAVLALVLFRYWPPKLEADATSMRAAAEPVSCV
jgi:membrane protease YdiL (CAAX protease family)